MQGGHLTRAGLAILLFASPAAANERFPTADDRSEVPLVYSIAGGFVFVDGVYVEAPYDVTLSADGESILINDHRIGAVSSFGAVERAWGRRSGGGRLSSGPGVRRGRRPGGPERGARFGPASRIRGVLDGQNGSVVATTGDPPIYLNYDQTTSLLSLLNDTRQSSEQTQELLADLPDEAGLDWELWLHDFISSEEFRQRRDEVLQAVAVDEAAQQSAIAAVRRFETYAYPLTVLGMLLGAIAFGHLLISLPSRAEFGGDSSAAAEIVRGWWWRSRASISSGRSWLRSRGRCANSTRWQAG